MTTYPKCISIRIYANSRIDNTNKERPNIERWSWEWHRLHCIRPRNLRTSLAILDIDDAVVLPTMLSAPMTFCQRSTCMRSTWATPRSPPMDATHRIHREHEISGKSFFIFESMYLKMENNWHHDRFADLQRFVCGRSAAAAMLRCARLYTENRIMTSLFWVWKFVVFNIFWTGCYTMKW